MSIYDNQQTRQELIVWMYSNKKVKQLQKYGFVYYISKKMKYAVLYTDIHEAEQVQRNLEKLHFVREVEVSPRQSMTTDYTGTFDAYVEKVKAAKNANAEQNEVEMH
ncbi:DUF2129 domain-containing protein [Aerococcus agrisoli]|uniref:DUF2129 domain-containing protein n=1 Tax=Aerococcus agrisoli TaxID=2487350 RepID=A0A3N4GGK1_9LACT|nr:YlbG family protein [Aerococcus agrisoli]RPA61315.1 DUF2129 domain-containing protein [Aerococcus agrisoli]